MAVDPSSTQLYCSTCNVFYGNEISDVEGHPMDIEGKIRPNINGAICPTCNTPLMRAAAPAALAPTGAIVTQEEYDALMNPQNPSEGSTTELPDFEPEAPGVTDLVARTEAFDSGKVSATPGQTTVNVSGDDGVPSNGIQPVIEEDGDDLDLGVAPLEDALSAEE